MSYVRGDNRRGDFQLKFESSPSLVTDRQPSLSLGKDLESSLSLGTDLQSSLSLGTDLQSSHRSHSIRTYSPHSHLARTYSHRPHSARTAVIALTRHGPAVIALTRQGPIVIALIRYGPTVIALTRHRSTVIALTRYGPTVVALTRHGPSHRSHSARTCSRRSHSVRTYSHRSHSVRTYSHRSHSVQTCSHHSHSARSTVIALTRYGPTAIALTRCRPAVIALNRHDLESSLSLGTDLQSSLSLGTDLQSSLSLGTDLQLSLSLGTDLQLSLSLGTDLQLSLSLGTDLQSSLSLGTDLQSSLSLGTDLQLSLSLGTDLQLSLSLGTDLQLSLSLGTDLQLSLSLGTDLQSSLSLGTDLQSSLSLGTDLQLSLSLGTDLQLSLSLGTDLQSSLSLGTDLQSSLSLGTDLQSSFLLGKQPTYQRSSHVEKYNQNMPTAGIGDHYCSMLDIEHLSAQPPYFNDFPAHQERNMSFEFSDILCENYTNNTACIKRSMSTEMNYYPDNVFSGSITKQPMSRTCSMSSEDNQVEPLGDVHFNSTCQSESELNSMKQLNVCNSDRICHNNDMLCNSTNRTCNNIERLCNTNEQMCTNSENESGQRYYNVSPSESPDVTCRWRNKHPENWDSQDVLDWLFYTAEKCNLDCSKLRAENFRSTSGADLCNFSIEDFERIESEYGRTLYLLFKDMREGLQFTKPQELPTEYMDLDDVFDSKRSQKTFFHMNSDPGFYPYPNNNLPEPARFREDVKVERGPYDFHPGFRYPSQQLQPMHDFHPPFSPSHHHRMNPCLPSSNQMLRRFPTNLAHPLNRCSMHENSQAPPIQRRRPGRPRIKSLPSDEEAQREKKVKNQHLWEFIYEVLMNPLYNPQYVRWENQREGVFRFVQSEAVAQLWGSLKNNDNMTYEKLSRAMRHYYKRGILERVEGRRLVYKFSRVAMDRVREKRHSVA